MSLYARILLPWLCDLALDRPLVARYRRELLSQARGDVLEIGFGTGLNLPHYPEHVRRLASVDPNPGMHRRARRRVEQTGMRVDQRLVGGEQLPFEEGAFDNVVSTFTLCSIELVHQAVAEVFRVLRPGGQFLLLEHGLSPQPSVQKWQCRLNWLQRSLAGNCHLDRNIRELIAQQPFRSLDIREFYLENTPRTHGYIYCGIAER